MALNRFRCRFPVFGIQFRGRADHSALDLAVGSSKYSMLAWGNSKEPDVEAGAMASLE